MTAMAQCLLDADKKVAGCDVAEDFVTKALLEQRRITVDVGFEHPLPMDVDLVVYTAAHQGPANPMVRQARERGVTVLSHADALGQLFNQKQGLAVCGVGGKSTTSAMVAWILAQTNHQPSFAIGVGNIPGLDKTGQWRPQTEFFVAEADEYVVDPAAASRGEAFVPRFSFLQPWITVCTNLAYDHPDVYSSFDQTLATYQSFFNQIKPGGTLICHSLNKDLWPQMTELRPDLKVIWFGADEESDFALRDFQTTPGKNHATLRYQGQDYAMELSLPGQYNLLNATAAVAMTTIAGVPPAEAIATLATFRSTVRRAEPKGEKRGVSFFDDYAHHPDEVRHVIHAFREWYPTARLVVAFQSHTFSRTKALFEDFIKAFDEADEVAMIDIFPSARENYDATVSSDLLCQAINQRAGRDKAINLKTIPLLATYLVDHLKTGDVCLTLGAGDIYLVHDMV